MKHGPMNTAVLIISAAALAALYKQTFSALVVLTAYNYLVSRSISRSAGLLCDAAAGLVLRLLHRADLPCRSARGGHRRAQDC